MIFAHRGMSGHAPENTMAAFRMAVELGCKAIELDVQLTADGEVVICHDETVDRTTNGTGLLHTYSLSELQKLDAGRWFDERFAGERIPTLEEALTFFKHADVTVNIELKNIPIPYAGIEKKVVELVNRYAMRERVIISSFDHLCLQRVAAIDPFVRLGVLLGDRLVHPWRYVRILPFSVYSIHPHYSFVDEAYIIESHKLGYKVIAYTIDDVEWYQKYAGLGIDGVFSNFPERFC